MKNHYKLRCYTDGSCYHKTRIGGIGIYMTDGVNDWFIKKGFRDTTISRMEGIAILEAIKTVSKKERVLLQVYSDSQYIVKSFTEGRLKRWSSFGFEDVKNKDMWLAILKELSLRPNLNMVISHIRGHQKDTSNIHVLGNNIADNLSNYRNHKVYYLDKLIH